MSSQHVDHSASPERVPTWLKSAGGIAWRFLVVAAAIALVVWSLSQVMLVVLPLLVALLLCTVLVPLARVLERAKLPRSLAALASLLIMLLVIGGVLGLIVPRFIAQFDELARSAQEGFRTALDLANDYLGLSDARVRELIDQGQQQLQDSAGSIGGGLLAGAVAVGEFVTGMVLTLVITFFLVKDRRLITDWMLARTPARRRNELTAVAGRAWDTLGGYFRGQATIAAVDAIGVAIGLLVIGVPLAGPLAMLTFMGGFFPIVGAVAAGMVAVLVALVDGGLRDALLVLAVVIAVQQAEGNILQPVVLGRAVPLHPLVILIVITGGAVLGGVIGAFLSVPIAAVISAVGNEIRVRRETATA